MSNRTLTLHMDDGRRLRVDETLFVSVAVLNDVAAAVAHFRGLGIRQLAGKSPTTWTRITQRAGCVDLTTSRLSRTERGVYRSAEAGLDDDGGRYTVVCEAHGSLVGADTLEQARATDPIDFCEECMAAYDR